MSKLQSRIVALSLMTPITLACGETVNYDTQEKTADVSLASGTGDDASAAGGSGASSGDPAAQDGLSALCRTGNVQSRQQTLTFPEIAAGSTCSFGVGENLSKRNGYFRAFLRQTQEVALPEGARLCGLSLNHRGAAMRYDDEMFFSVNNRLLLATKDYSSYFPKTDFFRSFSWADLKDKVYDSVENRPVFCAGGAEGISQCSVPPTETQGTIELKFSDEMDAKLSEALRNDNLLTFEWITTGDDDNSDCRHSEIDLDLSLRYVLP